MLKMDRIEIELIGESIVVISIGLIFCFVGVIFVTALLDFTVKERLFMGISWLTKSAIQAVLGNVVLD
jgi:hypothetical protein